MALEHTTVDGITFVNVTGHPYDFGDKDSIWFSVPPCGKRLEAEATSIEVGRGPGGVKFCSSAFIPTPYGRSLVDHIRSLWPDAIILGSILAARAYAPDVVAAIPVPGFGRVPDYAKRMQPDRFTIFEPVPLPHAKP
jgi:hypothetical protein